VVQSVNLCLSIVGRQLDTEAVVEPFDFRELRFAVLADGSHNGKYLSSAGGSV